MDQIVKALGLLNSFQINGLHGEANPTSGARLNLTGGLDSLTLTARDGSEAGITINSQGFGIGNLSLPTPQNPSIALDPYVSHVQIDLHKELFERLAEFVGEKLLAEMDGLIDRVVIRGLHTAIRMTAAKVVHADIIMDHLYLQQKDEELIRVRDVSLTILDFDTKLPPAQAQKECTVVLRRMRVEVEQVFFDKAIEASRSKIPNIVTDVVLKLPGPKMIAGAHVKKSIFRSNVRVDLRLQAEADLFGIHIERFYVPGTKIKVPNFIRDWILGAVRKFAEKKARGLVEVADDAIRIDPWKKIPVSVVTHVEKFAVEEGKIVIEFVEPSERAVPPPAETHALVLQGEPQVGDLQDILAPGPALI
ncbi:MAG: hypothetical protein WC314_17335 [Vulcanimicrobiota bacterium]